MLNFKFVPGANPKLLNQDHALKSVFSDQILIKLRLCNNFSHRNGRVTKLWWHDQIDKSISLIDKGIKFYNGT